MQPGYFGDAGGPMLGQAAINQQNTAILGTALQQASVPAKESSPVERELQLLEQNVKRLCGEIDDLTRQLAPVVVPQLDGKNAAQGEQTGIATSPLHRAIHASNVQLTKLAAQVAQLRASLSI